ncbi:MAG: 1-deoxy-D-xylulose-5-phosphate reductoisomerase [Proteobacteria bacterium]|jgi:1-deoxy-D-xylulose-5-phosphate reductoisomerase|nr:1-deoxy-D-xylulose-5-phosphate reductoisomerase [Desulfocapsa sp.]MBU3943545.1 1-deoxy-D-xylulose-5-phosphate reductoisomerase [Pseudomonadota bacterium]MCG2743433.1 1-deoxy-D-xylulose-5-phosphate reductoisomerase [Desulfobacteraceae bacterium]MBU3982962.1 1-deoxy-D-xylulose-5-phosphate reductoisomerase [Pseudomonadota bacterium]MBU4028908.1 1-deoxy-D-xylulose-5-phosphate reductoisomerase [Pseudomonadota bacterium]
MKYLALLGSTGSIGKGVLDVVRKFPSQYAIAGLAAGRNVDLLSQQALEFSPELLSVLDEEHADQLKALLPESYHGRIVWGTKGNIQVASLDSAAMTVSAIVGAAGLLPTLAAIEAGKDIGLANKETLVMAGKLVMSAARRKGIQLLPVDSEHSAIFQALEAGRKEDVAKIILTASGGPFLGKKAEDLQEVTPDQALAHPNWSMGRKISIDSATLMNKGLEVIEARWLFDVSVDSIEVVVHPQSIVHSLVEFQDGSVVAQLGIPDMRIPIAYALSYPKRLPLALKPLQLSQCGNLQFFEPDYDRFPALSLAFHALRQGGVMPAVLNAANEVAVEAFLGGRLTFPGIVETVSIVLEKVQSGSEDSLEDILAADASARFEAERLIAGMA